MIVGIVGSGGDGGTFLDWTVNFLSGNDSFYTGIAPAGKNVIYDFKLKQLVSNPLMTDIKTAHFHSKLHPDQHSIDTCIELLSTVDYPCLTFYCLQTINDYIPQVKFVENLVNRYSNVKFIVFHCTEETIHLLLGRKMNLGKYQFMIENGLDIEQDIRDKCILNLSNTENLYMLNVEDMFNNLDKTIYDIFDFIGMKIHEDRFDKWKAIYNEWQQLLPKTT